MTFVLSGIVDFVLFRREETVFFLMDAFFALALIFRYVLAMLEKRLFFFPNLLVLLLQCIIANQCRKGD